MKKIIIIALVFISIGVMAQININDNTFSVWQASDDGPTLQESMNGGWNDNGWSDLQGSIAGASAGLAHMNTFLNVFHSANDLYHATNPMDPNECQPDFATNAQSMMPTSCEEGGGCYTCYQSAVNELAFIRRQLGRLSCIYNNTKNYNQRAIAFGDNASGIHAVTGLSWQMAKGDIVAAYESFKHSYDDKYTGMMGTLDKALHDIGNCENQYGEHDWYERFGFIYYEFMKEKYKRTD